MNEEEREIVNGIMAARYAPKTQRVYDGHLRRFSAWMMNNRGAAPAPREGFFIDLSTVTTEDVLVYLGGLLRRTDEQGNPNPVGISQLRGVRSALNRGFKDSQVERPADYESRLGDFFRGLSRTDAAIRRQANGGKAVRPGKDKLPFQTYIVLSRHFLCSSTNPFVWSHAYSVLSWNLMCRTNNVEAIRLARLAWENDALVIYFAQLKNDQGGERLREPTYVYANPLRPEICPVLALGLHLALFGSSMDTGLLFPGDSQAQRFGDNLSAVLRHPDVKGTLEAEGIAASDIGTHSYRKGSITFASSGSPDGPGFSAVCMRARWTLGTTQDKYVRFEKAGDQFVGRTVAGLPLDSAAFAVLPPHFGPACPALEAALEATFVPHLRAIPHLQPVLRHCLASMLYHAAWLLDVLPAESPIRALPVLVNLELREQMLPHILCGPRSALMTGTGIPAHVHQIQKSQEVVEEQARVQEALARLSEKVDRVPAEPDGPVVSRHCMEELLEGLRRGIVESLGMMEQRLGERRAGVAGVGPIEDGQARPPAHVHMWEDERPHLAPQDWSLPRVNLHHGWRLWWLGQPGVGVPPFRKLNALNDVPRDSRTRFYEWRGVFGRLEGVLRLRNQLLERPSPAEVDQMFESVKDVLRFVSGRKRERCADLAVDSYVRKLRRYQGDGLNELSDQARAAVQ